MPMKLKNYYKNRFLILAPYNFLIFFDNQLKEPKISGKTISEYFGNGVLVFSGEILVTQRSLVTKVKGRYYKLRLNGSESFNKTFGASIFEKLLAGKIEGN